MVRLLSRRFERLEDTVLSLRARLVLIIFNLAGWFAVSISVTIYNKWLFSYFGLRFPLLVTSVHIALKIPLAVAAMCLLGVPRLRLARNRQTLQLGITGCATALDIGLSNLSFLFISVTVYTIGKSSVPIWILLISVALGLQRPSASLAGVVAAIVAGITVTASPSPSLSPSPSPYSNRNTQP